MGRKRRRQQQRRDPVTAAADQAAPSQPEAMMSGYDAANWSHARGSIWWPTLETRDELDGFSREELIRKIRFLYANVGLFRGFINNSADLLGWLTPQPATKDDAWNKEAYSLFEDRAGTKAAFDLGGKYDFWTAQPMLNRSALKDGDVLTVLTSSEGGAARVAFFEAHQLKSPPKSKDDRWKDGVLIDEQGRHLAYGLRSGKDKVVVVSARDVIYFGEFDSPGHGRAVPKMAHAVTNGLDITEIRSFTKSGIKVASLFGVVRTADNAAIPRSQQGLVGPSSQVNRSRPGAGSSGDGAAVEQFEMSSVFAGAQVPRMPTGEKVAVLHDARPSPNQMEFQEVLVRDISVGYGLPPEIVWKMAGLTGPGVRFVLDVADRWIRMRQAQMEDWARRVWVYTIAKEIKSGNLGMPSDGKWWRCRMVPLRNLTIDRGRDLRGRMEAADKGYDSPDNLTEELFGMTADEVDEARVRRIKYRMDLCAAAGVPYETAYPPPGGSARAVEEDPAGEEEEPPRKKGGE